MKWSHARLRLLSLPPEKMASCYVRAIFKRYNQKGGMYNLWVIFLLGAMSVAICALAIIYIANKIFIAVKKDQIKSEKSLEQEKTEDKNNE